MNKHVTITAKLIKKDTCEAMASTSKATWEEAGKDNRNVYEEIILVSTNKEV